MKRTVTILLSDKRSGSTLLEREICKHSGVNHVLFTEHAYNETLYWIKGARLISAINQHSFEGVYGQTDGSHEEARESLVRFLQRNVPAFAIPEKDEALVFDGWTALCHEFAHPVFFEKSPQHPHDWAALELLYSWIKETDIKVRIIGLIRNPMAVLHSAEKLFSTNPETRQWSWKLAYSNIDQFQKCLSPEMFMFLRYEDLLANPVEVFGDVCEFIGIKPIETMGSTVTTKHRDKWRDDPDFTFRLNGEIVEFAQNYGYTLEELTNPDKPRPNLYRRLKKLSRLKVRKVVSVVRNRLKRSGY